MPHCVRWVPWREARSPRYWIQRWHRLGLAADLLDAGYDVACHYHRDRERIAAIIAGRGADAERATFAADLTVETDVVAMYTTFRERFGPMYGVLNVAGASSNAFSWRLSLQEFRRVIDANLTSAFLCSRAYAPEMLEAGEGRIVNVSSIVGEIGVVGAAHYCAAKAGVIGLTKALALELAPKGIAVNALALGYFEVGLINDVSKQFRAALMERIPLRRLGYVSEVAAIVRYLLSVDGQYATGQVFRVNGGL